MMTRYLNSLGDIADIVEDAVDAMQQLRYGNETEARIKLLKITSAAMALYNHLSGIVVTADSEGEGEGE